MPEYTIPGPGVVVGAGERLKLALSDDVRAVCNAFLAAVLTVFLGWVIFQLRGWPLDRFNVVWTLALIPLAFVLIGNLTFLLRWMARRWRRILAELADEEAGYDPPAPADEDPRIRFVNTNIPHPDPAEQFARDVLDVIRKAEATGPAHRPPSGRQWIGKRFPNSGRKCMPKRWQEIVEFMIEHNMAQDGGERVGLQVLVTEHQARAMLGMWE